MEEEEKGERNCSALRESMRFIFLKTIWEFCGCEIESDTVKLCANTCIKRSVADGTALGELCTVHLCEPCVAAMCSRKWWSLFGRDATRGLGG